MGENTSKLPVSDKPSVVKKFPSAAKNNLATIGLSFGVVFLGILAGWFLSGNKMTTRSLGDGDTVKTSGGDAVEAGAGDESQFPETAEGTLREGGVKGEGTHYLERPGGVSQNAYMVSTSLDLSPFVGKKVKVWGKTISGVNAGWLLDVGKIRVLE